MRHSTETLRAYEKCSSLPVESSSQPTDLPSSGKKLPPTPLSHRSVVRSKPSLQHKNRWGNKGNNQALSRLVNKQARVWLLFRIAACGQTPRVWCVCARVKNRAKTQRKNSYSNKHTVNPPNGQVVWEKLSSDKSPKTRTERQRKMGV